MKLYNTPAKKIEDIRPLKAPTVTVYTCGPTVYDYPHIGNWFTFIRYDVLIRALKVADYKPDWIMNITDVGHLISDADEGEDKLEKGARREGKSAWDIAKFYGDYFISGLERLNITKPDKLPQATDHIKEQIDLISKLESKGYTYAISDGIYYDTSKFSAYAAFAHLNLDEQEAGKRVSLNPEKRNASDFALWKLSPKDHKRDMEWGSPWGKGFPGWHIECSAMSLKYLGETLDLHGGGIDHIPVHHTNEIAQSEAATGKPFVQHWFHSNFILVNGKKMAKSAGTFVTLEDIEKHGYSLEAFRLLVLESHYRSEAEFSWENLEAAQNRLKKLQAMADLRWQTADIKSGITEASLNTYQSNIKSAIENDLNTPQALAELSKLAEKVITSGIMHASQPKFVELLAWIDGALGLRLSQRADITAAEKQLVLKREAARIAQDYQEADQLRKQLYKQGISVRDTELGPIWNRL